MSVNRLWLLLLCSISITALAGGVDLTVSDFSSDNRCLIKSSLKAQLGLNVTRYFIYSPARGQDYAEWLGLIR